MGERARRRSARRSDGGTSRGAGSESGSAAGGRAERGLDALFDMVDVGQPPPSARPAQQAPAAAPASHFSNIVAAVARSARVGSPPTPRAIVGSAPERLEKAFQNLLSSILRHPEVRRIERTWRGLRLLVESCDKRAGVEVDILSSSDENVDEALSRLADVNVSRAPVDLLVIDRVVSTTAADLVALEKWAARAEAMLAPLVVGGEPEMVGAESLASIARSACSSLLDERRREGRGHSRGRVARSGAVDRDRDERSADSPPLHGDDGATDRSDVHRGRGRSRRARLRERRVRGRRPVREELRASRVADVDHRRARRGDRQLARPHRQ